MRFTWGGRTIDVLATVTLLLCVVSPLSASSADRSTMLGCAVRIKYERPSGSLLVTGHGTAFAVNLADWGHPGRRCLLTAAHNVLEDARSTYSTLKVEIRDGEHTFWSPCKVVLVDPDLDICLVESSDDIPAVCELSDFDVRLGERVTMAGSPRGVPVGLYDGTLIRRYHQGSVRSVVDIQFDHGCSGGPLFDAETGKAIGVAVAGIPKDGDLDYTKGLFVPINAVHSFLLPLARNTGLRPRVTVEKPIAPPPAAPATVAAAASVAPAPAAVASPPAPAAVAVAAAPVTPAQPLFVQPEPKVEVAAAPAPALRAKLPEPTSSVPQVAQRKPVQVVAGVIPTPTSTPVVAAKPAAMEVVGEFMEPPVRAKPAEIPATYVIEEGDNLTRIGRKFNITVQALMTLNNMKDPNRILVGSKLRVR